MELHNQEPTSFGDQDSVELQDAGASAPVSTRGASRVLVADASGVVVLPAGTELGDLRVEGRDLVVIGADGVRYVIPDGAIIVPQLVIGDVAIPPLNLAALLIGNEPQPAAGNPQSSGGNFASAVGPLQAAYGLGDLLPYTELTFPQPEEQEVIPQRPDREPDVIVVTPDQPAGATSATAEVNEAGLPARGNEPPGSNAASNSETTTGTIVFGAPDGLSSISINGTVITTVGQTITSPNGILTVTSIAPGVIGYSYTLADNMLGQTMTDSFAVAVTDVDGDVANATLSINVIDDAPDARNDTDSVTAGTYGPETGNVITGAGTTSGAAGADTQGADGARVTGISGAGGSDTTFDPAGNLAIAGTYGTLTIKADGSYSYVRTPNTAGGVTDTFTYTLTDGDGDTDTATLVISIGDSPASVVSLPTTGAGTIVDEEGLPPRTGEAPGTAQATNVETTSGTITVVAPDGIASVQIGGSTVTGPGQVITTPQGSLTITSYNPTTGTITYSFTLSDNTTGDSTSVTFPITVTDVDGDSDTKNLTITIVDDMPDAINDLATQSAENVPVTINVLANDIAGADSVQPSTVALVTGTLSGTGTLVNNGDGTFTYTPGAGETGTVTFDYSIADGDGDTDRATVTITLAADSIPTIAVAGDNTVDEAALPARAGEPAGSNAASADETAAGTIAITTGGDTLGSLVINGVNVTAGGTVTTAKGVLTVSVANGAYSYSYTLTDNTLSDPDSDTFNLVVTDSDGDPASTTLVIAIADDAPSAADDAAALAAGTYGPVSGSVTANDTPGADGIVVVEYTGATTGAAGTTVNGQYGTLTIAADGTFSYTRNPGTPGGVTDTFSYTIRDGDGDIDTANLVITIGNGGTTLDLPVAGTPGVTQVLEEGLPAGSNAPGNGEFASGTFTFTAPDGPAIVTIDGTPITAIGQTITGTFGTLTITSIAAGSIGYTYELTTNTSGDTTFDDFSVVVSDQDGDSTSGTLRIDIVDDVPTANDDVDTVTEDGPLTATGNVISGTDVAISPDANTSDGVADVEGADGATVTAIAFNPLGGTAVAGSVGGALAGAYGSLTLNADGSYSYVLDNANPLVQGLDKTETLTETFTYTLTDGDTDADTATLTITIVGSDDGIVITGLNPAGAEETVYEADLADGQSPDGAALTQTGSFDVAAIDGVSVISVGGAVVFTSGAFVTGQSISTGYGTLTITAVTPVVDAAGDVVSATVSYSYTLSDNTLTHTGANDAQLTDSFAVSVTDSDGTVGTDTVDITVVDDVIVAVDDMATQAAADEGTPVTINVFANDLGGADGKVASSVSLVAGSLKLDGGAAGGTLANNGDGTFTYTPAAGESGTITFDYSIADGDGDTDVATVTIVLAGDSTPSFKNADPVEVDEDGLASANVDNAPLQASPTETDGTESTTGSGTALFQFGNDVPAALVGSAVLVDTPALDGQLVTLAGDTVVFGLEGGALVGRAGSAAGAEVIRIELTTAATTATAGEVAYGYTVTLSQPVRHAIAGSEDTDVLSGVTIEVTDNDGDKTTGSFAVIVRDDVPTAVADTPLSVAESAGATAGVNLLANDTRGADGAAVSHVNLGSGFVAITSGTPVAGSPGSYSFVVAGKGTYVFSADGSWSFDPVAVVNAGNAGVDASFSYRITDGDNDASDAVQTVTITDGADPLAGTDITLSVDDQNLADGSAPAVPVTDSDTITFTAGSDAIASIVFGTSVANLDSSNLTWTRVSDTQIVGKDGAVTIVTLDLVRSGDSATVTATLSDNYDAHPTFTLDDLRNLGFVTVVATDTDGDTASNTVTVTVSDDVPTARSDAALSVVESAGATAGVNLLANDTRGADGAAVSHVNLGSGFVAITSGTPVAGSPGSYSFVVAGKGTYVFSADGSWSFDPVAVVNAGNAGVDASFGYRITDGDNDASDAVQTVTITDGADPLAGTDITLSVDDQNLADGSAPAVPVTDSDTITFTAGSDAIASIVFGTSVANLDSSNLTWTRVSDTQIVGKDTGSGATIVTLDLVRSGDSATVTATLSDNYDAHPTFTLDDLRNLGFVTVVATDTDGDTATNTVTVTVSDDVPSNFTPAGATAINTGTAVVSGNLDTVGNNIFDNAGADGIGSIRFSPTINGTLLTGASGTLKSGGQDIYLYVQPNGSLIASTDANPADGLTSSLTVFTATINAATGTYTIDFDRTIDNGSGIKIADFSKAGAGNTPWKGVDADLVNGAAIAIDAANDPNPDSTDLLVTVSPGGTVNSDSDDIGTSNQFIDSNEFVRIDLVQDLRFDPGKGTSDPDGYLYDTHTGVTQATFKIIQVQSNPNATAAIRISASNVNDANPLSQSNVGDPAINTVVNLDHTTVQVRDAAGNLVTTGIAVFDEGNDIVVTGVKTGYTVTFAAEGNATFEAFRMENAVGDPKAVGGGTYAGDNFAVGGFAYNFTAIGAPVSFNLPVVLTDGDGDTATGSIAVTLNPVTPIVLDLDGDGVEFIDASTGAMFDYNGDGNAVATGWAGADDGILAIDGNGSGSVEGGAEIVFGFDGMTDLEGLAAKYDTNHDGKLDASDADFGKFGVWQDADSDGVSDAGEFRSLADLGITSISLESDGAGYRAAGGDVTVYGSSSYTKADGSTGSLADAAFATKAKEGQRTAEIASVAALAGAAVDLTMAGTQPAAEGSGNSQTVPHVELKSVSLAEVDSTSDHGAQQQSGQAFGAQAEAVEAPANSLAHLGSEDSAAHLVTAESHFDHEAVGPDTAASDVAIAHGAAGSLFAGMSGDGVMAALLTMAPGQSIAANAAADVTAAIGDALSDFAGTAMVDAVVNHFAGSPNMSIASDAIGFDASFMLAQGLGGSAGIAGYSILPDAHDDASALAAAQA